ncbi:polysaccharide deacetylase family protein [Hymenobacter sp.]|jgi:peptidoglycan/xylan/chitin deacetylase (PgdA/CDA1 family)|uniref:polysaccharide deacetylase family protein n=1 Tax=Hymenobacter sp. TaxID=1898978 RepID=UPI002ED8E709
MRKKVASIANRIDERISLLHVSILKERPALLIFLFHSLYEEKQTLASATVDAQQNITVAVFSEFIEYFLSNGYIFISPDNIEGVLDKNKKYALITFDDGYFNNQLALPILRKYKVPAVFYVSANHVAAGKSFWWDVVYRQRQKLNKPWQQQGEYGMLKQRKNHEIEKYLIEQFGQQCLHPVSDLDRPFTPAELQEFARDPYVVIGNHTHNHAILTNYTVAEVEAELLESQQYLTKLLGTAPTSIAYPNGNYSKEVVAIAKRLGFQTGVTVREGKNRLSVCTDALGLMELNRFLLWGDTDIKRQLKLFRSDLHIKRAIRNQR